MPKTAVIILNWNGEAMMRRFLPALITHTADAEIVVADNGSTDASLLMLQTDFPTVKTLPFAENHGFAGGYNRAIDAVEAEYVVLLNSDVEVTEGWLQPLVEYMDSHRDVAACQPKLLSWHNRDSFEYAGAAGGGDGTINEIARSLVHTSTALATPSAADVSSAPWRKTTGNMTPWRTYTGLRERA